MRGMPHHIACGKCGVRLYCWEGNRRWFTVRHDMPETVWKRGMMTMGNVNGQNGPKAPKDPTKKRPAVYLMLDDVIEGTKRADGKFAEISFLEGRVPAKIGAIMPDVPQEMAQEMQTCKGLRKYVHSIGVAAVAQEKENIGESLQFTLNCRRENDYAGTCYRAEVPLDGAETLILLADYPAAELDTVLASFGMEFPKYMTAKMTIAFYLNDGYEVPELTLDDPVDFSSEGYRAMIARSLVQEGNLFRLKRAIAKARAGEDVTVAYIGGSITQGAGAKPIATNSYAYRSYKAFQDRFGAGDGSNVHFVKAGLGGTPSELGLCRYEDEVLDEIPAGGPDLVVIEFAVNDAGDETKGVCYESLARMAAKGPGAPAVVLLFAVFMDDFNLQERLAPVGERYGFPVVSLKNAVTPQFYDEKPVITKRQYFYDLYHPSNEGHRVMTDCLDYLWERADQAADAGQDIDFSVTPVYGDTYEKLKVFTKKDTVSGIAVEAGSFLGTDCELHYAERNEDSFATPEYPENWMHAGDGKDAPYRMKIYCKDLLFIYKDAGNKKFGKAQVLVDGAVTRTVDPLEVGWNHCNAVIVHSGKEAAEHVVEVRPVDAEKCFTIFGWGYTE